jgi:phage shock protein A
MNEQQENKIKILENQIENLETKKKNLDINIVQLKEKIERIRKTNSPERN